MYSSSPMDFDEFQIVSRFWSETNSVSLEAKDLQRLPFPCRNLVLPGRIASRLDPDYIQEAYKDITTTL